MFFGRPETDVFQGKAGEANGGAGGLRGTSSYCGTGAGNPGDLNGTGGTLMIYANNFNNTGTISANGMRGGKADSYCRRRRLWWRKYKHIL